MKIATHEQEPQPRTQQQYDGVVDYKYQPEHAERKHRQIIAAIEACETIEEVNDTIKEHNVILDSLFLNWPAYTDRIKNAEETHKAILRHSAVDVVAPTAITPNRADVRKRKMFTIDTGDTGGSKGPWMQWTSNGSAMKGFPPKSWVIRDKDEAGNKTEKVVPAFADGCVLDLDSLKLGWEKEGAAGHAPERRWNPSISQSTSRPDESKTQNNKFAWSAALSIRCAIGGGEAATWEQSAFGAYDAFSKLAVQISAQWEQNSQNGALLPLVKQTGVETISLQSGTSNKPILEIIKWVPRPECLKDDAPQIATAAPAPAPAPAPAAAPAPAPAAEAAVPDDVAF